MLSRGAVDALGRSLWLALLLLACLACGGAPALVEETLPGGRYLRPDWTPAQTRSAGLHEVRSWDVPGASFTLEWGPGPAWARLLKEAVAIAAARMPAGSPTSPAQCPGHEPCGWTREIERVQGGALGIYAGSRRLVPNIGPTR